MTNQDCPSMDYVWPVITKLADILTVCQDTETTAAQLVEQLQKADWDLKYAGMHPEEDRLAAAWVAYLKRSDASKAKTVFYDAFEKKLFKQLLTFAREAMHTKQNKQ